MIDTHCHLTFEQFEVDRDEVIKTARKTLSKLITCAAEPSDAINALKIQEENQKFVYVTLGMHPKFAVDINDKELEEYFELIKSNRKKIVGLGEIGLDYHWVKDPLKVKKSKRIFNECLLLANELKLPAILHLRNAVEDGFEMVLDKDIKSAVFHCYSGKRQLAEQICEEGYYVSIPTSIVRNKTMKKTVKGVPINHLLCETDAPYLCPEEGKKNVPQNVKTAYEMIAEIRGEKTGGVIKAIDENCERVFNFF